MSNTKQIVLSLDVNTEAEYEAITVCVWFESHSDQL